MKFSQKFKKVIRHLNPLFFSILACSGVSCPRRSYEPDPILLDADRGGLADRSFSAASTRPEPFTQRQAGLIVEALIGNHPLYEVKRETTWEDIRKQIHDIRDYIVRPDSALQRLKGTDPLAYDETYRKLSARIDALRKRMNEVADIYVPKPAPVEFRSWKEGFPFRCFSREELAELPDFQILSGEADLGKSQPAYIRILSSEHPPGNQVLFSNTGASEPTLYRMDESTEGLRGITISKEEAVRMADELIARLGFKNMRLAAVGSAAVKATDPIGLRDPEPEEWPQCFAFYYTRRAGSFPVACVSGCSAFGKHDTAQSNPRREPGPDEFMRICVDDTGIISFEWNTPVRGKGIR